MDKKIHVAILYGGKSTEHQISLLSAENIFKSLDKDKYQPVMIAIDQEGVWYYQGSEMKLSDSGNAHDIALKDLNQTCTLSVITNDHCLLERKTGKTLAKIDVLFPVLHGGAGEDGSIQGLARLANLPCVGPDVLGSSMGMDKDIMKRLLRDAGIGNAHFITLRKSVDEIPSYEAISQKLGPELFVKPANLGSSVGITFVKNKESYQKAIPTAFEFDAKVVIESRVIGREIEVAVLGNNHPKASIVGEVIPKDGFYSYEGKYLSDDGAALMIPADLDEVTSDRVRKFAVDVYVQLECFGLSRIDMFLQENGDLFVNEINTIPGFTGISMYPTLWKETGIENEDLVDQLISLAIERHQTFDALKKRM